MVVFEIAFAASLYSVASFWEHSENLQLEEQGQAERNETNNNNNDYDNDNNNSNDNNNNNKNKHKDTDETSAFSTFDEEYDSSEGRGGGGSSSISTRSSSLTFSSTQSQNKDCNCSLPLTIYDSKDLSSEKEQQQFQQSKSNEKNSALDKTNNVQSMDNSEEIQERAAQLSCFLVMTAAAAIINADDATESQFQEIQSSNQKQEDATVEEEYLDQPKVEQKLIEKIIVDQQSTHNATTPEQEQEHVNSIQQDTEELQIESPAQPRNQEGLNFFIPAQQKEQEEAVASQVEKVKVADQVEDKNKPSQTSSQELPNFDQSISEGEEEEKEEEEEEENTILAKTDHAQMVDEQMEIKEQVTQHGCFPVMAEGANKEAKSQFQEMKENRTNFDCHCTDKSTTPKQQKERSIQQHLEEGIVTPTQPRLHEASNSFIPAKQKEQVAITILQVDKVEIKDKNDSSQTFPQETENFDQLIAKEDKVVAIVVDVPVQVDNSKNCDEKILQEQVNLDQSIANEQQHQQQCENDDKNLALAESEIVKDYPDRQKAGDVDFVGQEFVEEVVQLFQSQSDGETAEEEEEEETNFEQQNVEEVVQSGQGHVEIQQTKSTQLQQTREAVTIQEPEKDGEVVADEENVPSQSMSQEQTACDQLSIEESEPVQAEVTMEREEKPTINKGLHQESFTEQKVQQKAELNPKKKEYKAKLSQQRLIEKARMIQKLAEEAAQLVKNKAEMTAKLDAEKAKVDAKLVDEQDKESAKFVQEKAKVVAKLAGEKNSVEINVVAVAAEKKEIILSPQKALSNIIQEQVSLLQQCNYSWDLPPIAIVFSLVLFLCPR